MQKNVIAGIITLFIFFVLAFISISSLLILFSTKDIIPFTQIYITTFILTSAISILYANIMDSLIRIERDCKKDSHSEQLIFDPLKTPISYFNPYEELNKMIEKYKDYKTETCDTCEIARLFRKYNIITCDPLGECGHLQEKNTEDTK